MEPDNWQWRTVNNWHTVDENVVNKEEHAKLLVKDIGEIRPIWTNIFVKDQEAFYSYSNMFIDLDNKLDN